jgi:acetylornithine aminotransferase
VFADALQPGDHSTTQGGGPLACAAVLATLRTIEEDGLIANAAEMGKRLAEGLRPFGAEVRGAGLLLGLDLGEPRAGEVVRNALEQKLVVNDVTPSTVRFAPPLIVTADHIDDALDRFGRAVKG